MAELRIGVQRGLAGLGTCLRLWAGVSEAFGEAARVWGCGAVRRLPGLGCVRGFEGAARVWGCGAMWAARVGKGGWGRGGGQVNTGSMRLWSCH